MVCAHCAPLDVEPKSLPVADLENAARELGRLRGRVDAAEAKVLAELAQRSGPGAESFLPDDLKLSTRDARVRVQTATGLTELPVTAAALAQGEITAEHAKVLTRAADTHPVDEAALLAAARAEPADTFTKTVRRHQNGLDDDSGAAAFERLRGQRKAPKPTPPRTRPRTPT